MKCFGSNKRCSPIHDWPVFLRFTAAVIITFVDYKYKYFAFNSMSLLLFAIFNESKSEQKNEMKWIAKKTIDNYIEIL